MRKVLLYTRFKAIILVILSFTLFYLIYENFFNPKIIEGKRRRRRKKINFKKIGRDARKGVQKLKEKTSGFTKEAEQKASELGRNAEDLNKNVDKSIGKIDELPKKINKLPSQIKKILTDAMNPLNRALTSAVGKVYNAFKLSTSGRKQKFNRILKDTF
jgi:F0F1-type ATP synthase membrane subunit b/b'